MTKLLRNKDDEEVQVQSDVFWSLEFFPDSSFAELHLVLVMLQ